jgi:hypothetical protein
MGALLADTRFKLSLALNDAGLYGTEAGRRAMCTVQVGFMLLLLLLLLLLLAALSHEICTSDAIT